MDLSCSIVFLPRPLLRGFAVYVSVLHWFLQKVSVKVALCVTTTPVQSLMQWIKAVYATICKKWVETYTRFIVATLALHWIRIICPLVCIIQEWNAELWT